MAGCPPFLGKKKKVKPPQSPSPQVSKHLATRPSQVNDSWPEGENQLIIYLTVWTGGGSGFPGSPARTTVSN